VSESPSDGNLSNGQTGEPEADQQASQPAAERYSDWRDDGSPGRFTEPPGRPSGESPVRPGTSSGQRSAGRPDTPSGGRSGGSPGDRSEGRPGKGGDPVGDMQRWLMKAGARSMANQVADNVRRSLGQQKQKQGKGDVWDTATTEMPPDEPPECQWCPVCQAARRMRVSGPGLSDKLASAGGILASVVQDAFSVVEQAMKTPDEDQPGKAS
jgi:hypothetical protein